MFKPVIGTGFNISSDHIKLRKYVFRFNSHPNTPFCSLEDLTGACIIFLSRYRTHARTSCWRHKQRYNGACRQRAIGGATVLIHWHVVKSLKLIWRSGTRRWNLQMSDLQMSRSELKTGCRDSNSSNIYHSDRPYFTRSPEPNWVFWCVFFSTDTGHIYRWYIIPCWFNSIVLVCTQGIYVYKHWYQ